MPNRRPKMLAAFLRQQDRVLQRSAHNPFSKKNGAIDDVAGAHGNPCYAATYKAWDWIVNALNVYSQSALDQQIHLVQAYYDGLAFRRFQIDLRENIEMDDVRQMDRLLVYGERLGRMILKNKIDPSQGIVIKRDIQAENLHNLTNP